MRLLLILALIATGLFSVPTFAQAPNLDRMDIVMRSVPDGPVAKVRGVNISREEYVKFYTAELGLLAQRNRGQLTLEDRAGLGFYCLRILVQHELLYQEAQRLGKRPTDAEVREAWKREREKLRDRIRRNTGETVSDVEVLERTGYRDEADVLREVRRSLMIESMSRDILDKADFEVDEESVRAVYEERKTGFGTPAQLHLQQVFVQAEDGKGPQAQKARREAKMKAEDALLRIQTGQSFEAIVRQVSDGRNKETGGHMGPLPATQFPPFMVEAVADLKPGEFTGVLESEFGYHIVRLVESIAGSEANQEAAKSMIRQLMTSKEGERIIGEYCDTLVKDISDLEVFLELEKNLAYLGE